MVQLPKEKPELCQIMETIKSQGLVWIFSCESDVIFMWCTKLSVHVDHLYSKISFIVCREQKPMCIHIVGHMQIAILAAQFQNILH